MKKPRTKPAGRARRPRRRSDPIKPWARRLRQSRPGLVEFVLDRLAEVYGRPVWQRVHDPTSELVLTILSQNSADVNAEKAFEALRRAYPSRADGASSGPDGVPAEEAGATPRAGGSVPGASVGAAAATGSAPGSAGDVPAERTNRPGWGGTGLARLAPPDWMAVELAPLDELIEVIRPGGLAPQKAPRIQASLARIREAAGSHSLEFLGDMAPREARDWLTSIDGIGVKTASVVLLFSFGMPLMPVDRHVERVSKRIGLLPAKVTAEQAHDRYLGLLAPEQCYPMHVELITHGRQMCHAQRPECDRCPVAPRCRYVDRAAP
jgi:endonuclease-3